MWLFVLRGGHRSIDQFNSILILLIFASALVTAIVSTLADDTARTVNFWAGLVLTSLFVMHVFFWMAWVVRECEWNVWAFMCHACGARQHVDESARTNIAVD